MLLIFAIWFIVSGVICFIASDRPYNGFSKLSLIIAGIFFTGISVVCFYIYFLELFLKVDIKSIF